MPSKKTNKAKVVVKKVVTKKVTKPAPTPKKKAEKVSVPKKTKVSVPARVKIDPILNKKARELAHKADKLVAS
jgi:hypothetical protein